ncbi:MAG: hypothetical protein LC798_08665 [Chloroflexi bacterium]|nr:hypothetical protein [Chloroflexota bacterium]
MATLTKREISTRNVDGATLYLVTAMFATDEGHHVHDDDPRFKASYKRADASNRRLGDPGLIRKLHSWFLPATDGSMPGPVGPSAVGQEMAVLDGCVGSLAWRMIRIGTSAPQLMKEAQTVTITLVDLPTAEHA